MNVTEPLPEKVATALNLETFELPPPPPGPPKTRTLKVGKLGLRLLLILAVIALAILTIWKLATIRAAIATYLPYLVVLFPSAIAAGTIKFKDWNNYKPKWVRWLLLGVVLLSAVVAWSYQNSLRQDKLKAAADNKASLELFKSQATAAQNQTVAAQLAQADNTKQYLGAIKDLSAKLNTLQTKAATEELNSQITQLKTELKTAETSINPKSGLTFTLPPIPQVALGKPYQPILEANLPAKQDGSVQVEFAAINTNEAAALDGEITLILCDTCKFAKEPDESKQMKGQPNNQRNFVFFRLLGMAEYTMSADIIPPAGQTQFPIGLTYRCKNCAFPGVPSQVMIHITSQK